nr:putative late blight resistance protein homolog R1B-14 [Ipomoea batatas]
MAGVVDVFAGRLGDRLVQVVEENVTLLKEIKDQVDDLVGDIKSFEAYLKQAESRNPRSKDNDVVKNVVAQIWNLVIKADNAICKYTVEKKKHKNKGWVRYFESPAYYSRITASAKEIQAIRDDFKEIRESNAAALHALADDHGEAQPAIPVMAPVVEEIDVVGFDSEAKLIKDLLMKGPRDLTVITIEGMAGLSKTRSETKPSSEHVRSFLSSCSNEIDIPTEHLPVIPNSFPLLRVVDIESLKLKSLPKQLYHLYHLRYLAVSTDGMRRLPKDFNKFENMQTLVFNTSQDSVEVEADIWSLSKLRHVRTNTCMQLPPPSSNSTGSAGIRALSFISPSSCTAQILGKTPNLQKLGIRGDIVEHMHMESKEGRNSPSFENLGTLSRLDNLKLLNNGGRPGELQSVPQHFKFPKSLRKLTLSNMWLEWKDMRILGALDELEVLKLKEHAFMGESWELSDEYTVFKQLRFLMIGRTDLVVWKTSASCFPALQKLVLKDCTHLREIPLDFAYVPSLMQMELYGLNEGAANSAQKIQMEEHELRNDQLKLLIN